MHQFLFMAWILASSASSSIARKEEAALLEATWLKKAICEYWKRQINMFLLLILSSMKRFSCGKNPIVVCGGGADYVFLLCVGRKWFAVWAFYRWDTLAFISAVFTKEWNSIAVQKTAVETCEGRLNWGADNVLFIKTGWRKLRYVRRNSCLYV